MPKQLRLLDSGFVDPAESAALDEAILEAHIARKAPDTLHFYVRKSPTVSVGYFQKISESLDLDECRRRGVAIVRRKSGGSSIYTDRGQLIYGLVVSEDELPKDRAESFKQVCTAIARAIGSFGVDAIYRPMNDVEVGGRKISGNAQLRRKGSLLQHGTVVVDTDLVAVDAILKLDRSKSPSNARPSDRMTTLTKLLGGTPGIDAVKDRLAREISSLFTAELRSGRLTVFEKEIVRRLVRERYSRDEWNFRF